MRITSDISFSEFRVDHFPDKGDGHQFATLTMPDAAGFSDAKLYLRTTGDCDELIEAAQQARSLLAGETSEPVPAGDGAR